MIRKVNAAVRPLSPYPSQRISPTWLIPPLSECAMLEQIVAVVLRSIVMVLQRIPRLSRVIDARRKLSILGGVMSAALGISYLFRDRNMKGKKQTAFAENASQNIHITRAITVTQPVEAVYQFWRRLTNLPQVIDYIESVYVIGNTLTRWTLNPDPKTEFDVETYIDIPNSMISWRSLPEAPIQNAGSVRLQPVDGGTKVQLTLEIMTPADTPEQALIDLIDERYVDQCLQEFKQLMENTSIEIEAHGGV